MKFLAKLSIAFLLFIFIAIVYRSYFPVKNPSDFASQIVSAPIVDEVIAIGINLPTGKTVTPDDIKNGTYPILALRIAGNQYILNFVNRIGPLWTFDRTQDELINSNDPVYSQLALAYINPDTKTVRLVPISTAGIRAIILDTKHHTKLVDQQLGLPAGYWQAHSQVIMADGSTWLTHHVPLPTTYLDSLKTDPDSKQTLIPASG